MILTSDKDIGRVGLVARLGDDAECVEAFVLLVEVCECESGPLPTPVHLHPFGGSQQLICPGKRQQTQAHPQS